MRDPLHTSDEDILANKIIKEAEKIAYQKGQEFGRIADGFVTLTQLRGMLREILGFKNK